VIIFLFLPPQASRQRRGSVCRTAAFFLVLARAKHRYDGIAATGPIGKKCKQDVPYLERMRGPNGQGRGKSVGASRAMARRGAMESAIPETNGAARAGLTWRRPPAAGHGAAGWCGPCRRRILFTVGWT